MERRAEVSAEKRLVWRRASRRAARKSEAVSPPTGPLRGSPQRPQARLQSHLYRNNRWKWQDTKRGKKAEPGVTPNKAARRSLCREQGRQGRPPASAPGSHSGGPPGHGPEAQRPGEEARPGWKPGSVKVSWAGPSTGSRRPSSQPGGIRGSGDEE